MIRLNHVNTESRSMGFYKLHPTGQIFDSESEAIQEAENLFRKGYKDIQLESFISTMEDSTFNVVKER